ncbi:MAG TPA: glutamate-5-semialdehyde dehydrogenase [Chitinophagaceae bacterium]|nr:glutamate-5-semialdehyde dehydrogenase [Chitinophagaceae bacterium]
MEYTTFFEEARKAERNLLGLQPAKINLILKDLAAATVEQTEFLLRENKKDLDRMDPADPRYDRLKLTAERIGAIAQDMVNVAELPDPLGRILTDKKLGNGLQVSKVSVPLGVVGIVYEARPNVTFDVFSLCFKTGNVAVLKGGSDAASSNLAIISVIHAVLTKHGITTNAATLLPPEREATEALLNAVGYIDVVIPRGSQNLINYVREHARVPVIETGAGIVHTYFDETADLQTGAAILLNAKTRRPSVCNSLDCLLIHRERLENLPELLRMLGESNVELFADSPAFEKLDGHYPPNLLKKAEAAHFGTEFLSLKMAVKTVDNLEEAIEHIARFSSKHSEAILSSDPVHIERFLNAVDAAAVYANASTAFTDGAQFGLGAEIGISTQKLHARGPMGLEELTSYKWLVRGQGQVRP